MSMPNFTSYTHTEIDVQATSTKVLDIEDDRKYVLFVNDSDEEIYLKFGAAAVVNEGIRLNAGGGSFEMNYQLGNLCTAYVRAICASGTKNLLVTIGA